MKRLVMGLGALLLSTLATLGQTPGNETTIQSHVVWSIAHEGCRAFSGNKPRPAEEMRPCLLAKEAHNAEAFNLLKAASTDDLAIAIKQSLPIAYEQYQIPANFEWVLTHEHQLELFRSLERSGSYERIRGIYFQLQEHNPNARYALSAVSDDQIKALIDRARVVVLISPDTSYSALKTIDSFTEPTATTPQTATTIGKLVSEVYGSANKNIARLVAEKNSLTLAAAPTTDPNEIAIPAKTTILLPSIPAAGSVASIPRQPLTGGCATCVVTDPQIAVFVDLREHGTPVENEIFGHVEVPAGALQSVSTPSAADFGWYLPFLGLSSVSSADFNLVSPVAVAIVDSGADVLHIDLMASFWKMPAALADGRWTTGANGYDFIKRRPDPSDEAANSHGTHVSGLVAGEQIAKWEPEFATPISNKIKLVELKIVGKDNVLDSAIVQNAILAGVKKGIRIFNCSFELEYGSEMLRDYLNNSNRIANTLFIVAAGNNGEGTNKGANLDNSLFKQDTFQDDTGTLQDVILVAALGRDGKIAPFSNYGPRRVSISAPGTDISSTTRNSNYGLLSGTSQAAPFVTLAAAMLLSELPSMSLPEIHQRILDTCDWVPELVNYVRDGCRLNIEKATIVNRDLIELKTGAILKGTVSASGISVPGASGAVHKLERIWFTDPSHMIIVATDGRFPVPATSIEIKLPSASLCFGKATSGLCVVPASAIKDVVFRASAN